MKVIRLIENLIFALIVAIGLLAGGLALIVRAVLNFINAVLGIGAA